MPKRITVIQGHPDAQTPHFCHALADAYIAGAKAAGHEVQCIEVAALEFPLLRSKEDFEKGAPPPSIVAAQEKIRWAEHVMVVYPLWMGFMPAVLKAFLEQTFRPGFAFEEGASGRPPRPLMKGKSARMIVTMGMPSFYYRLVYRSHSVKALGTTMNFTGFKPIASTIIGSVDDPDGQDARAEWLEKMSSLGRDAT